MLRIGATILSGGRSPTRLGTGGRRIALDNSRAAFGGLLGEFAPRVRDARVKAIAERFSAPLGAAVLGRHGVGRGAVAAALAGSGVPVAADAAGADVHVVVVAETLKPEERAQLQAACQNSVASPGVPGFVPRASVPTMVVLNKADLSGVTPGGPLAGAERQAADFGTSVGLPVVPMIAPLATVELDDEEFAALRALVRTPADMTSTDAFVSSDHPLPTELRQRLLERLDRFGVAHAVLAVADGATVATVSRQLRALSGVDRAIARLTVVAAPVRYRRLGTAMRELRTLAARTGDSRLEEFLTSDEVIIAVMEAAVDVVEAAGFTVDQGEGHGSLQGHGSLEGHGGANVQLRRAARWRTYAQAPVGVLHQRCAKDIARGSLRLLGRAR